jgi:hypothetical protein
MGAVIELGSLEAVNELLKIIKYAMLQNIINFI